MSQRHLVVLSLVVTLFAITLHAGDDPLVTASYPNGKYWELMLKDDENGARMYILGYLDASKVNEAPFRDLVARCKCSVEDVKRGVTAFYELDPAYRRIPIPLVIGFSLKRATGTSREQIMKEADLALTLTED
jgi:hypothetical protein